MKEDAVSPPTSAVDVVGWLSRMGSAWGGTGIPIVLDLTGASWIARPSELVDVMIRMGVTVSGVCSSVETLVLPPGVVRVPRPGGQQPSWGVCRDVELAVVARRLRSGQVFEHDGDVLVDGDLAPGAEIIAGGSVFVRGATRGRVMAGRRDLAALILCQSLRPELVSIGDHHVAGDRIPEDWTHSPVQLRLREGRIRIEDFPDLVDAG